MFENIVSPMSRKGPHENKFISFISLLFHKIADTVPLDEF